MNAACVLLLALLLQDEPKGERAELKLGTLFVPEGVKPKDGRLDLVVHFHGSAKVVEREFAASKRPAALVSIHVGAGSSAYSKAMKEAAALQSVIDDAFSRIQGAKPGRIHLSSFSAGYGAIREILNAGKYDIASLLLADSLHCAYEEGRKLSATQMEPFIAFAKSGRPMWVTHSAIAPGTYASTTETADALVAAAGAKREACAETNARGMKLVSRADKAAFHVRGYEGTSGDDHLVHLQNLREGFAALK